jgi:hypothetical protein
MTGDPGAGVHVSFGLVATVDVKPAHWHRDAYD